MRYKHLDPHEPVYEGIQNRDRVSKKDAVYFMTEMTQVEFEDLTVGVTTTRPYEYNCIKMREHGVK